MTTDNTPKSNRLHITLLGRTNSGKSSLLNFLTGQEVALTSELPGTTTDPVRKPMEFSGIGACLIVDTAGFADHTPIGEKRMQATLRELETTDVALLLIAKKELQSGDLAEERELIKILKNKKIAYSLVITHVDSEAEVFELKSLVEKEFSAEALFVDSKAGLGREELLGAILRLVPEDFEAHSITGNLVAEGDLVLLVMPQDRQAPKGRLILPQVQTIRELLDKHCTVVSCQLNELPATLRMLNQPPHLIITDSQVFNDVFKQKPEASLLTSFSVLFAGYKGDIESFVEGAKAIGKLSADSHVLIAEACTHAPLSEDIGRVKIPNLLRKRFGEGVRIDMVSGRDFPEDLSGYDLIIHCGACMFNRRYVMNRLKQASEQSVPMTNYGVTIAYLSGILDKISY